MKISERFADYGLTGAFFWLTAAAILAYVNPVWPTWSDVGAILPADEGRWMKLIEANAGALVAAAGVVGVAIVFMTGLLLDLIGSSYFLRGEVNFLRAELRRNRVWLARLADRHADYIGEDWRILRTDMTVAPGWRECGRRQCWRSVKKALQRRQAYSRAVAFLLSHVLLACANDRIDGLKTRFAMLHAARAFAVTLLGCSLFPAVHAAGRHFGSHSILRDWVALCASMGLLTLALFVARRPTSDSA